MPAEFALDSELLPDCTTCFLFSAHGVPRGPAAAVI
jgi:hypothetical protein